MNCKNCTKYNGNCGYHFIDSNGHINWDIPKEAYTDRCGICNHYESNKIKHTFTFKTSVNWKPGEDACWIDCPFAFNINLSERCRCFESDIKCPFIRQ